MPKLIFFAIHICTIYNVKMNILVKCVLTGFLEIWRPCVKLDLKQQQKPMCGSV